MTPDIRKTVDVPLTPAQAFDLFTAKLDTWWPSATHSVSAANDDTPICVKIEPRKGDKITEKLRDGTSATWAPSPIGLPATGSTSTGMLGATRTPPPKSL